MEMEDDVIELKENIVLIDNHSSVITILKAYTLSVSQPFVFCDLAHFLMYLYVASMAFPYS